MLLPVKQINIRLQNFLTTFYILKYFSSQEFRVRGLRHERLSILKVKKSELDDGFYKPNIFNTKSRQTEFFKF